MNSAPLNNLINELTKISEKHDNCLADSLKLYQNQEFEDRELEPSISNIVSIDKPIQYKVEEVYEDLIDIKFDENGLVDEITGTINSLLIESSADIDI
jgi:hypothetical protein